MTTEKEIKEALGKLNQAKSARKFFDRLNLMLLHNSEGDSIEVSKMSDEDVVAYANKTMKFAICCFTTLGHI